METDPFEAQAALDVVAAAEKRSAQIATSTRWYAPWYGVSCAAFPVAIALIAARSTIGFAVLVLGLASLAALMATYQRITGVWPVSKGLVGPYLVAFVVLAASAAFGNGFATAYGVGWWLLPLFLVTGVLMSMTSRYYDRAYARKHGA